MIIIKNLFKAVLTISAFSIFSRFLSFIYKVYLSNQITTSELGVYSVALSICMIFLTILTAGLPLIISRSTAETAIDNKYIKNNRMISSGLLFSSLLSIIVTVFIILFKPFFKVIFADNTSYIVLLTLIPFLIASGIYAPIKGFLWGKEDYYAVSIVELFEQVIKIISCIVLFNIISNPNLPAGLSMSIACVASTILGFIFFFRKKGKLGTPFPEFKNVFRQSTPFTLIRVAGSLLQPLISIVLPLRLMTYGYTNSQAMSLLGIVMGMTFPLLTIPTTLIGSLSMALTPRLTILQKQNDNSNLKKQTINSLTFTLFCCFIFVPIFFSLGKPVCEFLFNNSAAGYYLEHFAWVVIPMGLSMISTSILNSLSEEKFVLYTYFISSIFMIFSILFLPKYMGIEALLLGLGLQNISITIFNIIRINKILKSDIFILHILTKFAIISIITGLLSKWTYSLLIRLLTPFISMITVGILSTISFIILCYAFGIYAFQLYFQKHKRSSI